MEIEQITPFITKRDGRCTPYRRRRIHSAIEKAMKSVNFNDDQLLEDIVDCIEQKVFNLKHRDIDKIQDIVEKTLIDYRLADVAQSYIGYRRTRDLARERRSDLISEIDGLINQTQDELLNENANKDSKVISTQRDLLAGIMAKHYAKSYLLDDAIVQAHEQGDLHYHDLDYAPFFPMFNCMLVDLEGMLLHGFKMGNADIDTPKSINTATSVTAQIIAQVASHIYGGTTIDRIDEVLAPYVTLSYEKHRAIATQWAIEDVDSYAQQQTEKECYDAFQALEYEVNTLHTSNGQTPFVTFGFGLGESWQAKLIQESILKVRIKGLGKSSKTAVFPKLVFAIKEGLNRQLGQPHYDVKQLALKCATTRMYPDILNYEQVIKVTGSFKTPMGCRSFLSRYVEDDKEIHAGRNNLGVVSLNLPRIGLQAKNDVDLFWQLLDQRLLVAKRALLSRIDRLREVKAKVAPILYTEGACGIRLNPEDSIVSLFENGRATVSLGYIGLHETVIALIGGEIHPFDSEYAKHLGEEITRYLKRATEAWQRDTGWGFSLYATPSENLCHRFCQLDQKEFGLIKDITDKGYYTNSFHLDVEKKVNPYDKLDFEAPFPAISNGGFICYGEYPNLQHNLKALEDIWDYSYDRVPYYGTNMPIDHCFECDFQGEFTCTSKGFLCPACGNNKEETISVTRRVCGYLGAPNSRPFNRGKQEEVKRRVKHMKGELN